MNRPGIPEHDRKYQVLLKMINIRPERNKCKVERIFSLTAFPAKKTLKLVTNF